MHKKQSTHAKENSAVLQDLTNYATSTLISYLITTN